MSAFRKLGVLAIGLGVSFSLVACSADSEDDQNVDGRITVSEETTTASKLSEAEQLLLNEPFEISTLNGNSVFLTVREMTVGEECRFGMYAPDYPQDELGEDMTYFQVLAEVDVRELNNPQSQGVVYLELPKVLGGDGFTRDAQVSADCQDGEGYEQWMLPTASGDKARRYGAFIIPRDAAQVELFGKTFEVVRTTADI